MVKNWVPLIGLLAQGLLIVQSIILLGIIAATYGYAKWTNDCVKCEFLKCTFHFCYYHVFLALTGLSMQGVAKHCLDEDYSRLSTFQEHLHFTFPWNQPA